MLCDKKLKSLNNDLKEYFIQSCVHKTPKEKVQNELAYFEYANSKYKNAETNFNSIIKLHSIINNIFTWILFVSFIPFFVTSILYNMWGFYMIFFGSLAIIQLINLFVFKIQTTHAMNNWKLYLDNKELIQNLRCIFKNANIR